LGKKCQKVQIKDQPGYPEALPAAQVRINKREGNPAAAALQL
jgi:hypothetical protein